VPAHVRRFVPFAALEASLWLGLYVGYLALRDVSTGSAHQAVSNGLALVHAEEALGLFHEASVQTTAEALHLEGWFDAYYLVGFGPALVTTLVWLGVRHRDDYRRLRTWLLVSLGLASVLYVLVPTAPPRLVPGLDIGDTVGLAAHDTGSFAGIQFNPYAAMPSMHVGWTLLVAIVAFRVSRHRLAKAAWALYPLGMTVCVVATGNHYFVDAIVGAATALVAVALCNRRVRSALRPRPFYGYPLG
jgi:PAP2 superfamily